MLRIVGIVVVVVVLMAILFAMASRWGWNPLATLATPPASTSSEPAVPSTVVP